MEVAAVHDMLEEPELSLAVRFTLAPDLQALDPSLPLKLHIRTSTCSWTSLESVVASAP